MEAAAWFRGSNGLVVAFLVTVCGVLIWRLADGAQGYLRDSAASVFVAAYLPLLAGFAVLLAHPDDGAARVIVFVATVVCSDTGGYASGVLFGRHPLAPMVSKGKTWEGLAGSVLACCVVGALFLSLTFHEQVVEGPGVRAGDRGHGDSRRPGRVDDQARPSASRTWAGFLPGHGGLMDRLDSLLPCAAVAYLLLSYFAPV